MKKGFVLLSILILVFISSAVAQSVVTTAEEKALQGRIVTAIADQFNQDPPSRFFMSRQPLSDRAVLYLIFGRPDREWLDNSTLLWTYNEVDFRQIYRRTSGTQLIPNYFSFNRKGSGWELDTEGFSPLWMAELREEVRKLL